MECKQCEGKGKLPLFPIRYGYTDELFSNRYYPCPTCGGTEEEDQMENKISAIHHIVGIGEGAGENNLEVKNIVEVKIEHGADIFNPKEPDPIKVGDEVEYSGFLDYGYETGVVEEIRSDPHSNMDHLAYKINGTWHSEGTNSVRKKVDEKDIAWGTVEEVINGGMNTVNEEHSWEANIKATVIDEALAFNKDLEKGAMRQTVEEVTEEDKAKWKELTNKKHRTTLDEDMMNFLIED